MFLSTETVSVLKNFSTINQSILIKEGSKLRSMSVMKNILVEAEIDETFNRDIAIYDLSQFLNCLSLIPGADLQLNETSITIAGDKNSIDYRYSDPSVVTSPPDKELKLPSEDVCFELSTTVLDKLLKAAAVYQLPDVSAVGEAGVVKLVVRDKKNDTSNRHEEVVGETSDEFSFNFKVENIKVLPGTYDVVVSQKLLSRFTSKNHDLTYYIALEPDSTFG